MAIRRCFMLGLLGMVGAVAHAAPFAYVPNTGDDTLTIIDTATDTVVDTIPIPGSQPQCAAVSPDGYRVFVGALGGIGGKIHVVDAASRQVTTSIGVFSGVLDVAVTPDGSRVYGAGGASVKVIDADTETFMGFVSDPSVAAPDGIAVHPSLPRVYASAGGFDPIMVIDTATNTVVTTISQAERSIVAHPDGTRLFGIIACTFCFPPPGVQAFDAATNTIIPPQTVTTGVPSHLGIHPSGNPIFATTSDGVLGSVLSRIDTGTNLETLAVSLGSEARGVAVHPDGTRVYVVDRAAGAVHVVDPATLAVLTTIPVGPLPIARGAFIGPIPTCGDGVLTFPETCDDGGVGAGDGCDASCEVESFCSCTGEPSTCECATQVPVSSRKLVIVDKLVSSGSAKLVYVAQDPAASKGVGTDVDAIDVTFQLGYDSASGAFTVPAGGASGWKVNKATVAKFVNKDAPGGPTGAKVVVVKPGKLLKLVGKTLGDTPLDILGAGAPAGPLDTTFLVRNGGEEVVHCSRFAAATVLYKSIAGGVGAKLVAKGGVPIPCP